ncbi:MULTISPECIES: MarR family winged helix-turn-helix transcriptional regulator [unclassified Hyphomicrobium]|uniref:MarR family winged helix-turn-helix transcriptional regulator n=1 Tax=unclassified Hyphomicrobium TaxID=2619925 RepID=UPI000213DDAB|nr:MULTISPECIES: MarR family transcriptional regulator [unclassified Hyphomicrobium]CCB67609.1 transcriptional regulator, MarR family [Hyphomicrobium sp. MC1]
MAASKEARHLRRAFTQELYVKSRLWRRLADGVASVHGLSDAVTLPVILLGRFGVQTQTELADAMGVEGPTLVRHLDQLCAMGLIQRQVDPNDRRAKQLSLTPAGQAAFSKLEASLANLRDVVFADVPAADLEACLRVFQSIQDYIEILETRPAAKLQRRSNP